MVLAIEKYLIPHHTRYHNVERPAEKRQDPAEQEDTAADHGFFDEVPIEYRAGLGEQPPEDFISDLDP